MVAVKIPTPGCEEEKWLRKPLKIKINLDTKLEFP